jgi:hypothetical protein
LSLARAVSAQLLRGLNTANGTPRRPGSTLPGTMKATAILKIVFGAAIAIAALRQLGAASSRSFESGGERGGYYLGTALLLALAVWLVASGIRSRRGNAED